MVSIIGANLLPNLYYNIYIMIRFTASIKKFSKNAEKSGWSYIEIPAETASGLHHVNKTSFRVIAILDKNRFDGVALVPAGNGDYILPVNATMRKALRKKQGDTVDVVLEKDNAEPALPAELMECLEEEEQAFEYYKALKKAERNYFIKWILSARTDETRAKRMALSIHAFLHRTDFGTMIRNNKKDRISG